jgi:hypothetical protein
MQPSNSSIFTSLALKTTGVLLILTSIVDIASILTATYPWNDADAQFDAIRTIVNSGLMPLVGTILVIIGDWVDVISREPDRRSGQLGRLLIYGLSILLAIVYAFSCLFPLANPPKADDIKQATEQLAQVDAQIKQIEDQAKGITIDRLKQEAQAQIAQIKAQVAAKQIPADQAKIAQAQIEQIVNNPTELQKRAEQIKKVAAEQLDQQKKIRQRLATEIRSRQGSRPRTSLASFLLAIGYAFIGFFGMKEALK